jgi:hypothetical protein
LQHKLSTQSQYVTSHRRGQLLKQMHFAIKTEDLVALNAAKDAKKLEQLGGVAALATALNTNLRTGLSHTEVMTSFESRKTT